MACCTPNTPGPGVAAAESCKRVNYALGMLLGVDDFVQEQVYNGSRRRELAREVLGYGTLHGLRISIEANGDKGPQLRVSAGMAWLPSGTPVCVESDQCANFNDWLAAHAADVQTALGPTPGAAPVIPLYAVLSYAQHLTDSVPIPGEPCRSDNELMEPSRIADSFQLELRLAPPQQKEEDAMRDFVGTAESQEQAAPRRWATELRPQAMARADCSCNADPISALDDAVLLARLDATLVATLVGSGWQLSDQGTSPVTIDETRRPVLLSLRMVQELACARADHTGLPALSGDLSGTTALARIEKLQGIPVVTTSGMVEGQVLTFSGGQWVPKALPSSSTARGPGTDAVPAPALAPTGTLRADVPGLAGDVVGPIGTSRLQSLQGQPLNASRPMENQVLRFVGGAWTPVDLPDAAANGQPAGPRDVVPYQVVAAGEIRLVAEGGQVTATMSPTPAFGTLDGTAAFDGTASEQLLVSFQAGVAGAEKSRNYIVKLTPIWQVGTNGFQLYLADAVKANGDTISFQVRLVAEQQLRDGTFPLAFQLEVSRF